ncbi:MAG TPA: AsnC family transcriptional regulator [Bacillota bacterium]|nr:AsnC family transcriptional regulator [Bacillota bacterium]
MRVALDTTDRKLLGLIQAGFPLVPEPYRTLGEMLGVSEDEVIGRIGRLIENGVIRRLGGIFDSGKLGYHGALCAARVEDERIGEVAEAVNSFSGVTHNYLREHYFNMWFTVLARSREELEEIIGSIKERAGIVEMMILPAENIFKIRVKFDL